MRCRILAVLSLLVWFGTSSCASTGVGCVIPPPMIAESERDTAVEIASILESLPGSGNLMADFQDAIRVHFDRLSEPNACLFLFLKAIECYLDQGDVGSEMAREMAGNVRVAWAHRCGFADAPLQLTPSERAFIERSKYDEVLKPPMRRIGIR